jgi:hypothetical protein
MKPNSIINSVRVAHLGETEYARVAAYLRESHPHKRRSYAPYMGTVFGLDDTECLVTFQDERLLPVDDRGRPRLLILISNAHPESIKNGMFHTAESGIADLWTDLQESGLFSGDPDTLASPDSLREWCLEVRYEGPFCFGFACYWVFPTFLPKHLRQLFRPEVEPPGFRDTEARFQALMKEWQPQAIISFNGEVFKSITGKTSRGYLEELRHGTVEGVYRNGSVTCHVFQTFPAGWRYHSDADLLRRESLRRIANQLKVSDSGRSEGSRLGTCPTTG